MGMTPAQAARFSFLLAIPALFGAGLLHLLEALNTPGSHNWLGIVLGSFCAFASGWLALRAALALVTRGRFWMFAVYCAIVGIATIVWSIL